MPKFRDLTNTRFGKLLATKRDTSPREGRGTWWVCKCDCGNSHSVEGSNLTQGRITHCGCTPADRRTATHCDNGHEYTKENTYLNPADGGRRCRKCSNAGSNRWKKQNKVRKVNTHRKYYLKRKYGITLEDYNRMLLEQEGRCAICKELPTGEQPWLHVDHSHETGQVRRLLCFTCNVGLGSFQDDPDLLSKAIVYLKSFDAENLCR